MPSGPSSQGREKYSRPVLSPTSEERAEEALLPSTEMSAKSNVRDCKTAYLAIEALTAVLDNASLAVILGSHERVSESEHRYVSVAYSIARQNHGLHTCNRHKPWRASRKPKIR